MAASPRDDENILLGEKKERNNFMLTHSRYTGCLKKLYRLILRYRKRENITIYNVNIDNFRISGFTLRRVLFTPKCLGLQRTGKFWGKETIRTSQSSYSFSRCSFVRSGVSRG